MLALGELLDIPCFALETSKLDWDKCGRLEDVAAELLRAVKQVAPEGPVLLGGLGFGCRIAFEMALQLEAEQHTTEVQIVIQLDLVYLRMKFGLLHNGSKWIGPCKRWIESTRDDPYDLCSIRLISRPSTRTIDDYMRDMTNIYER
jgi:hypothetical protein